MRTWCFFALVMAGCARTMVVPPTSVSKPTSAPESWSRVLSRRVDARGRIDFAGLYADSADLDTFLGWVARVSPASQPGLFPTRADRLAYYLNAYNAWALKAAVSSGTLPEERMEFFLLLRATVGGRAISLRSLKKSEIDPLGEPRTVFALSDGTIGAPRPFSEPFEGPKLEEQLRAAERSFLNDERLVRYDADGGVVRVAARLRERRRELLGKGGDWLALLNAFRDKPIPPGTRVEFLPDDADLNRQPDPSVLQP
ncbi:MAG TPA: DUF547 domain-containing protein [Elusimicrobiota bacterium]|nr:DUF547 domain-containing protein [Elusimicrobiota bacterium]